MGRLQCFLDGALGLDPDGSLVFLIFLPQKHAKDPLSENICQWIDGGCIND
jgi:hypothetical protein